MNVARYLKNPVVIIIGVFLVLVTVIYVDLPELGGGDGAESRASRQADERDMQQTTVAIQATQTALARPITISPTATTVVPTRASTLTPSPEPTLTHAATPTPTDVLTATRPPTQTVASIAQPDGQLICRSTQLVSADEGTRDFVIDVPQDQVGFLGGVSVDGRGPAMITLLGPYHGTHTVIDGMYCGEFRTGEYAQEAAHLFRQQICFNCTLELVIGPEGEPLRAATPSNKPTPTLNPHAALIDANGYVLCSTFETTGVGQVADIEVYVPDGQIGVLSGWAIDGMARPSVMTVLGPYRGVHSVTDGAFCGYFPASRRQEVETAYLRSPNCAGCALSSIGPNVPAER